jgi:hypothetical protein
VTPLPQEQLDLEMAAYFDSLPPRVQDFLLRSDVEISTPGELQMVAEHLENTL